MDVLTIILLFVVVILIITTRYAVTDRIRDMEYRMDELHNLLKQQQKLFKSAEAPAPEEKPAVPPIPSAPQAMQSKSPEPPRPEPVKIPAPAPAPVEQSLVVERHPE